MWLWMHKRSIFWNSDDDDHDDDDDDVQLRKTSENSIRTFQSLRKKFQS